MLRAGHCSNLSPLHVLKCLKERNLLKSCTKIPPDIQHMNGASVYVGFDPTADSLHIGNLVTIIALIHFQHNGYQPLAVVGGATGIIGDPSGRIKERDILPHSEIHGNIIGISQTLSKIFQNSLSLAQVNSTPPNIKIINNDVWYKDMSIINFMSNIGRHFRLSSMLNKESVRQRLHSPEGISFTEFSYQVFQAYDFLCLSRDYNCWLQIGGGDQWGNISAGCEFIHKYTNKIVHGLTVPLITTSSGEKLGKSSGNAVWLSSHKTSPYHLYQYFYNTRDSDVENFLNYFTFSSNDQLMREHKESPEYRVAQKHLAKEVTHLIHGEEGVMQALNATSALFGDHNALLKLSVSDLYQLFNDVPTTQLPRELCTSNISLVDIIVKSKAASSNNEVRRLIQSGGLYINNIRVESASEVMSPDNHMLKDSITVIRTGKKNYYLIKWI